MGRDHCPVLWMPTMSVDVPTTPGAYCRTMAVPPDADIGGRDGLMWRGKLSADGSCLLFGTYFGTSSRGNGAWGDMFRNR